MTISKYLIDSLIKNGITDFFLVTGGAIIPTVDYLGELEKEGKCIFYCFQHEQSAAMAAEGYFRASGKIACVLSTSGPGAQNLLNGVCGCWFDSIPAVFITGQTNEYETIEAVKPYTPRQVGFQECPVVKIFESFTKHCVRLSEANYEAEIKEGFSKLLTPRMGPILFDIPVNVQNTKCDSKNYPKIRNENDFISEGEKEDIKNEVKKLLNFVKLETQNKESKPLVLIGNGSRDPESIKNIKDFIETNDLPFVLTWGGFDLIDHNHKNFVGHIGVYGKREANFAIQNCDLLFVFGSRLDTRQTGGKINTFAEHATKIVFDIDENEVLKRPELKLNNYALGDLKEITRNIKDVDLQITQSQKWENKIDEWSKAELPIKSSLKGELTSYEFLKEFFDKLPKDSLVIPDQGGNLVWTMQSAKLNEGQNLFSNFGNSSMGYALPAAIGAYLSGREGPIYCIDGDGGFQMNIQELQTIVHYNIPIKIIILNNRSYGIIKQFQDTFFGGRYIATDKEDYSSPYFTQVASAYSIKSCIISRGSYRNYINSRIFKKSESPELYEVLIDKNQKLNPKLEFGNSLENMSPYLPAEEVKSNMFYTPQEANIPKGWVDLSSKK